VIQAPGIGDKPLFLNRPGEGRQKSTFSFRLLIKGIKKGSIIAVKALREKKNLTDGVNKNIFG